MHGAMQNIYHGRFWKLKRDTNTKYWTGFSGLMNTSVSNNNNKFTKRYDKCYKDIQWLINSNVHKVEAAAMQWYNKRRSYLNFFDAFSTA